MAKEQNPRIKYADIIDMPHHQSTKHPHMSLYDRAAQFMPFSALTGYDDMVKEETRITDSAKTLEESMTDIISQKLNLISEAIKKGIFPTVEITYFIPDSNKDGGKYITVNEKIKKIDSVSKMVVLVKSKEVSLLNETIPIKDITDIKGDIFDSIWD